MTSYMDRLTEAREAWIIEESERYRIELAIARADGRIDRDGLLRHNTDRAVRAAAEYRWTKRQRKISVAVRRDVLSSETCTYCGDYAEAVDHIIPVSRGGTNDRENLTAACTRCNMEKLDFTPDEWCDWRQEIGHPWPPLSRSEEVMALIRRHMGEEVARRGVSVDELFDPRI